MAMPDKQPTLLPPTPPYSPPLHDPGAAPCTLASLPNETVHHVLSYLPPPALAAVARTSRALLPLARAALYAQLTLRNQRDCTDTDADTGKPPLDARSSALFASLRAHPAALATLAHRLDFDLVSHLGAEAVGTLLASVFALCPALTALRLGAGSHGHGIGYRGLYRAFSLAGGDGGAGGCGVGAAARLRTLDVAACAGAPHTLARVLLLAPAVTDLRIGQFLLEDEDVAVFCGGRGAPCALETLHAHGRLTPTAFAFVTAASGASLRSAALPLCDDKGAALDLAPFSALSHVELRVFLAAPPTPFSPAHAAFAPTMARLARNFRETVHSARDLAKLALSGAWDCSGTAPPGAGEAVDLVRHAGLLELLPRHGLRHLSVRTELNALALAAWLADDAWWGAPRGGRSGSGAWNDEPPTRPSSAASTCVPSPLSSPSPPPPSASVVAKLAPLRRADLARIELWQKTSYAAARRDFQARVRDRVDAGAAERGVEVVWRWYERW
ncbi:hypothetical protein JCM3770_005197 [Rhodotorula araucariae]